MIIAEALSLSEKFIESDSARLDAELLLAFILGKTRTYLFTWPDRALTKQQEASYLDLVQRREAGEPIAYLIHSREFWSLPLSVGPSTLIPRPDTEVLVEAALAKLPLFSMPSVLDLGTGTGAIALAIAKESPVSNVQGVDFDSEAVALAEYNRSQLGLSNVRFFQSNWFSSVQGEYDLVLSNPPYIDKNDPHLQTGDVRFEPLSALVADKGGLADIEHIIRQAPRYLRAKSWLLLEHGCGQAAEVKKRLQEAGFADVFTQQDYGGNDRVTGGSWST